MTKLESFLDSLEKNMEYHSNQWLIENYPTTIPKIGIDNERFVKYIEEYLEVMDLKWCDYNTKWKYEITTPNKYNIDKGKLSFSNVSVTLI